MPKLSPINDRQRQVLERINEGLRPVTRLDSGLVVTVNALVDRKLVEKKKISGGGWIAVITDAGKDLLAGRSARPNSSTGWQDVIVHEPVRVHLPAEQTAPQPPPRFTEPLTYSVEEAAYILGCTVSWLQARTRVRDVPHVRLGQKVRFTGAQLLEILEACSSRPLPNYFFGNPWGVAPGSRTLATRRSAAIAAEQAASGRPPAPQLRPNLRKRRPQA